jgi:hypothetical protein
MRVIVASKRWIIALLIASAALVAASLASPLLRFATHGPDILMNASSLLARNNPCIPTPETGTYMDASERSKLLKDVRVRFGDVDMAHGAGRLVIGVLEDGVDRHIGRIRSGRLY